MKQGEEACIADMRNFINAYSLRQTTVAMMTGKKWYLFSSFFSIIFLYYIAKVFLGQWIVRKRVGPKSGYQKNLV